uniref:maleylacetoacetate isomerase n=1 Tax=Biomphalaria glabrata TaxID=6526 RepID=A0A2C9L119_BIOGL
MMTNKVILYSFFRSSASWRVRIALAFKEIKYEYRAVNLFQDGGQQNSEEYKRVNPMGQVPALIIDGHTLTQSFVYFIKISTTMCGKQVRALSEIINSGIQPYQNLSVLDKVGKGKDEWAKSFIEKGYHGLETFLKQTSGKYSYGNTVTMADLFLVPQMFAAKRYKVNMEQFPTISQVYDSLIVLPAFKAADAVNQPDMPPNFQ